MQVVQADSTRTISVGLSFVNDVRPSVGRSSVSRSLVCARLDCYVRALTPLPLLPGRCCCLYAHGRPWAATGRPAQEVRSGALANGELAFLCKKSTCATMAKRCLDVGRYVHGNVWMHGFADRALARKEERCLSACQPRRGETDRAGGGGASRAWSHSYFQRAAFTASGDARGPLLVRQLTQLYR
jgi:hypothetical protein